MEFLTKYKGGASLILYNILGEKMNVLLNNVSQFEGIQKETFDMSQIPPGIYISI